MTSASKCQVSVERDPVTCRRTSVPMNIDGDGDNKDGAESTRHELRDLRAEQAALRRDLDRLKREFRAFRKDLYIRRTVS
jgi:hypothetical protein